MAERNITPIKFPSKLKPRTVLIIVIAIFIVIGFFSSLYQVGQYEKAVILLFGKKNTTKGPGLHWKLPFGIEQNYNILIKRTITQEFGFRTEKAGTVTKYSGRDYPSESIMLTGDKNIVDVEWTIHFEITDPEAWLFNVEHMVQDRFAPGGMRTEKNLRKESDLWYEKTIRDVSQSVINQIVGDTTILKVIGDEGKNIQEQAKESMNEIFRDYGMGIKVTEIALRNTLPPEGAVRDSFEDVNKAEQDRERFINEGYEEYNKAKPDAEGKAAKMVEEAKGYASARVNYAEGDVARFKAVLEEYKKAPEVTRTRLYIEMYEEVFGQADDSDLIDRNLKNFIPFKPLGDTAGGIQ